MTDFFERDLHDIAESLKSLENQRSLQQGLNFTDRMEGMLGGGDPQAPFNNWYNASLNQALRTGALRGLHAQQTARNWDDHLDQRTRYMFRQAGNIKRGICKSRRNIHKKFAFRIELGRKWT
jgi:hypothetical protein